MISKRYYLVMPMLCMALVLTTLSGCIGGGDNTSQAGLIVHFAESHLDNSAALKPARSLALAAAPAVVIGGYDQVNIEHHDIRDQHGRALSIYRAFIVLDNIELVPCNSIAEMSKTFLGSFIQSAQAHAGHGSEPVGGRALDAPNVIDIVTQEGYFLPLGDAAIAPGNYCGLRIAMVRLASTAYGKPNYAAASTDNPITQPETPDLSGLMLALRADYCQAVDGAGVCTQRVKVDIDDDGLLEPAPLTIEFAHPLTIGSVSREVYVVVGIDYGRWLQNVDVTLLSSSTSEKQKVLDNIAASIHVYDQGFGALPPNI